MRSTPVSAFFNLRFQRTIGTLIILIGTFAIQGYGAARMQPGSEQPFQPFSLVHIWPQQIVIASGSSVQFTAAVGQLGTELKWNAGLGTIDSSGHYIAPMVSSQTLDTVTVSSASDPTLSSTAIIVIQASGTAIVRNRWTVGNQQPVTQQYYHGSIFTMPLPADVSSHLYPNSDAIVSHIFGNNENNASVTTISTLPTNGSHSGFNQAFYYASEADPVFRVDSCSAPPSKRANNPSGLYFHLTSGATWDSDSGDQDLTIWDQSTDLDATPGGRILSSYYFQGGPYAVRALPRNCSAKTKAQADAQPACHLKLYYCNYSHPQTDSVAWAEGGAWASAGYAAGVGELRGAELMSGSINHALIVDVGCVLSGPVFPAFGDVGLCSNIDHNDAHPNLHPHNGAVFWIDGNYNCHALPAWQQAVCKATQQFGAYLTDAGGSNGVYGGIYISHAEGGMAFSTAGITDPVFGWLLTQAPNCSYGLCLGDNGLMVGRDSATTAHKVVLPFYNMPGLITNHHLHIVDPCVIKRMARVAGAC